MINSIFNVFRFNKKSNSDYLAYAKAEFGKDWLFAYHYMINNDGNAPRMGVYN